MITPPLYRCLSAAATPLVRAALRRRAARGKEDEERLDERLGVAGLARPDGTLVWVHAVSVGETVSVIPLITRIVDRHPRVSVLLTTGTTTAAALARDIMPPRCRHQFAPVDLPAAVRRFLDHWRPDLGLFVESELWPNLLLGAAARRIPLALVGGRMSDRSWRRWQRMPRLIAPTLAAFDLILTRTPADAVKFTGLGAGNVRCVGDLKSVAPPLRDDPAAVAELQRWADGRPAWLAASTHAGEEEIAVDVHQRLEETYPGLLTVIVPRHPERGDPIARMIGGRGRRVARRSRSAPVEAGTDIYLADTLGELGVLYRFADIAFVGGSLVTVGGHNLLEAARLDCAILHGPEMANFRDMVDALRERGAAIEVADGAALADAVATLLADPAACRRMALAAKQVAQQQSDVLDTVLASLEPLLDRVRAEPQQHACA